MYCVKKIGTRGEIESGFRGREEAKVIRNQLNEKENKVIFVVSRSKNHPKGETNPVVSCISKKEQ